MKAGKGADGSGGRGRKKNPFPKSGKGYGAVHRDVEVAKEAGVSEGTVHKVRYIEANADEETVIAAKRPPCSI